MGLADEIEVTRGILIGRKGPVCTLKTLLDHLDPEDRRALEDLLKDPRVFGSRIARLLKSWAPKVLEESLKAKGDRKLQMEILSDLCGNISEGTVQRHRRRSCHCSREGG